MKKRLSLLLVFLFLIPLFSCFSLPASAEALGTAGDNLTWKYENRVLTISGKGDMPDYSFSEDAPWLSVLEGESSYSVVIEEGVTGVGDNAFYSCYYLSSVSLPDSLTKIGSYAFGFTDLTSLHVPAGVKEIGESALISCDKLTKITVDTKNSVYTALGNCLIEKKSMTLMAGCKKSVVPDGVRVIGEGAFYYMNSWGETFEISLPDSVTRIADRAFYESSLSKITLPDSLTSIGEEAFSGTALTRLDIPRNVTSIGSGAFGGCSQLQTITVDEKNTAYEERGNCLIEKKSMTLMAGCKKSVIPDGVRIIGEKAFYNNGPSETARIPEGVTEIGAYAFRGWENLNSMTLPDSVKTVGDGAFSYCESLTSVELGEGVTTLPYGVFRGCTKLERVTLSSKLKTVEAWAFGECTALQEVWIRTADAEKDWQEVPTGAITVEEKENGAFWNANVVYRYEPMQEEIPEPEEPSAEDPTWEEEDAILGGAQAEENATSEKKSKNDDDDDDEESESTAGDYGWIIWVAMAVVGVLWVGLSVFLTVAKEKQSKAEKKPSEKE